MCTLILAGQVFPDAPVVVGANRDEATDRPSTPPAPREWGQRVLAPRDEEAGGTWIGVAESGLFVGVTNRWTDDEFRGERSRGLLVRDALECETADAAGRLVERAVEAHEYAGFNLVVADATTALLYEWDGHLRVRNFEPGVHVVVNVGADDTFDVPAALGEAGREQVESVRRARGVVRPEPGENVAAWRSRIAALLADHDYGFCVHGDGFGTRSSSLLGLGPDGADWAYADGPPCETAYRPVDGQL